MWCTQVDIQKSMIHGKHAMNKSIITQTIATKGMILERSDSILTHVFAPSRKKSDRVEVDEESLCPTCDLYQFDACVVHVTQMGHIEVLVTI